MEGLGDAWMDGHIYVFYFSFVYVEMRKNTNILFEANVCFTAPHSDGIRMGNRNI